MKQNAMFFAFVVLLCATVLTGCKVGEDDPAISLKSRNARITGTWRLTGLESTVVNSSTSGNTVVTTTTTRSYNGTTMTENLGFGGAITYSYSELQTINKDGTYSTETVADGYQERAEGYWWWLNDTKDQARIAFDDDFNSVDILQLKNKEVVFATHLYSREQDIDGDFDETTVDVTATYTKE